MTNEAQVCWVLTLEGEDDIKDLGIFSTREKATEFVEWYCKSEYCKDGTYAITTEKYIIDENLNRTKNDKQSASLLGCK